MLDSQQCPSLHVLQPQVKSFGSTSIASHPNRWNLPKKSSSPSRYTNIHSEDEYITSFSINVIGWLELSSNKIKNKQINKKLRQTLISCKLRESLKRKRRYLMFTVKNTRQRESPTKKKIKNEKNRRADTARLSTNEIKSDLLDKSKSSNLLSSWIRLSTTCKT